MDPLIRPNPPKNLYLVAVPDPTTPNEWMVVRTMIDESDALKVFAWYAEQRHAKLFQLPVAVASQIMDSHEDLSDIPTEADIVKAVLDEEPVDDE